jgi:hypothetical protein
MKRKFTMGWSQFASGSGGNTAGTEASAAEAADEEAGADAPVLVEGEGAGALFVGMVDEEEDGVGRGAEEEDDGTEKADEADAATVDRFC